MSFHSRGTPNSGYGQYSVGLAASAFVMVCVFSCHGGVSSNARGDRSSDDAEETSEAAGDESDQSIQSSQQQSQLPQPVNGSNLWNGLVAYLERVETLIS